MGILKGALSARRYVVRGEVPEAFRATFPEALNQNAFHEPFSKVSKEEVFGWVQHKNLLDTDFSNLDDWLYNQYALFSLRADKKSLPAKLFKATVDKELREWCVEHGRERPPRNVKEEVKERIEHEWLQRALPRVAVVELVWNIPEGWVLFHSHSESANDRFRKLFHRTFGLELHPLNPLDLLGDPELARALERTGGSDLRGET
ncbi:recombination-associated protein RdgC [Myxococcota bacterium]|nr:recombination-associated protein RdgC [Myxococcota bacterium]